MVTFEEWVVPVFTKATAADLGMVCSCVAVAGLGATAAQAVALVEPGSIVAVVGCGGIGSNAIQGARMAGARSIAAIDPVSTDTVGTIWQAPAGLADAVVDGTGEVWALDQEGTLSQSGDEEVAFEVEGRRLAVTRSVAETVSVLADPSPPQRTALPEHLVLAKEHWGR